MDLEADAIGNPVKAPAATDVVAFGLVYAAAAAPALHDGAMSPPALAASLALAVVLILLSAIDLRTFRLPDVLTLPLCAAGIALAGALGWDTYEWRAASTLIGFASAYLVAAAYERLRGQSGLGLGDAKLLAAAGAWLGAQALPAVVLYACGAALLAIGVAYARKLPVDRTTKLPFGPFLAAGTWLVWLYGPPAF
jgi:leader peptidase (prepilin peptidase) / N-methyltransferase